MNTFLKCLWISLMAGLLAAQTVTGSLEGRVTDPSGSVLPGAKITVKNKDTNLTREAVTNSQGYYQLTFLPLGEYTVVAEAQGFARTTRNAIVELATVRAADFQLQLSSVAAEVTVSADAALIDTARGEVRNSLDEKTIEDRPLPSRNILSLVEQMAGFQSSGSFGGVNNPTLSSGSYVSFNGTGTRSASFQVDGVNNDDNSEGTNRQNVNISSIKEFQVLTNAYSAEFGRAGGAVVLVQTKSGTNRWHGDLYEFLQNDKLNSNSFVNNALGRNAAGQEVAPRPPIRRNQFGGTVGGPILRNKLFFFLSGEATQLRQYTTIRRWLIPAQQLQVGECRLCLNPAEHPNLDADRRFLQSILDRFPRVAPNATNVCPQCFVGQRPSDFPDRDYSAKLDWIASAKNTVALRYQYSRQRRDPGELIPGEVARQNNKQQNLGLTATQLFTPTLWGEFRFGLGLRTTTVNISGGNDTPVVRISNPGPAAYSTTLLGNANQFPILRYQTDFQYVYNLSWIAGKHVIRAGVDYRRQWLDDRADQASRGFWNFAATGVLGTAGRYEGYENFLRGFATSFQRGYGNFFTRNRSAEFNQYIQDDFKLTPNLTLNLGLRYEYVLAPKEVDGFINYGYGNYGAFQPRFGFAWVPVKSNRILNLITGGSQQSAIRGGFGMFNNRIFGSIFSQRANLRALPPYGAVRSFDPTFNVADPSNGFVFRPDQPVGRIDIARVDPSLRLPWVYQWNFTFDRQFGKAVTMSLGYNGTRGIGLLGFNSLNRAQFPFTDPITGIRYDQVDPNPANTTPAPGVISQAQPRVNNRRPDPRYLNVNFITNNIWTYYHSLRAEIRKRNRAGFHWSVAYTLSKSIDTGSDAFEGDPITEFDGPASNRGLSSLHQLHRLNLNYSYELPWFKRGLGWKRQVLGGWQISGNNTFATGNPFTVLAGTDVNGDGINNDRGVLINNSFFGTSVDNGRVDPATGRVISTLQLPATAFLPPAARFFDPGGTGAGSLGRNTFFGQGITFWDLGVTKKFAVREGHNLTFRAEMYNVTNTPRWAFPGRSLNAVSFGVIAGTYNPQNFVGASRTDDLNRVVQLSLRYIF